jgi:hypothetical protein
MGFTARRAGRQKKEGKVRSVIKRSGQAVQGMSSAVCSRGHAVSPWQVSASNMAHFVALARDLDCGLPVWFGGPQGLPHPSTNPA